MGRLTASPDLEDSEDSDGSDDQDGDTEVDPPDTDPAPTVLNGQAKLSPELLLQPAGSRRSGVLAGC